MIYNPEKKYDVEIFLVDQGVDRFVLTGKQVIELKEKIYLIGYVQKDKSNPKVTYLISPYVISSIKITEK